ncbi:hypothetical protein EES44_14020 [Streptomyces sp. ADI96-15]|nr:hypothetical protein EES44_14020 [Streptomyces sp. ADI96-15]
MSLLRRFRSAALRRGLVRAGFLVGAGQVGQGSECPPAPAQHTDPALAVPYARPDSSYRPPRIAAPAAGPAVNT